MYNSTLSTSSQIKHAATYIISFQGTVLHYLVARLKMQETINGEELTEDQHEANGVYTCACASQC